ncbi:hypothetical protein M0804_000865 [Polistes exclamans]|nr:hypothetical protein M0804_000865 [Polistes exclamans]
MRNTTTTFPTLPPTPPSALAPPPSPSPPPPPPSKILQRLLLSFPILTQVTRYTSLQHQVMPAASPQ